MISQSPTKSGVSTVSSVSKGLKPSNGKGWRSMVLDTVAKNSSVSSVSSTRTRTQWTQLLKRQVCLSKKLLEPLITRLSDHWTQQTQWTQ